MAREQPGQTLQATALVHEAYLRLVDVQQAQHWNSRGHFFCAAAEAMRRILVENARRKQSARHGGDFQRVELLEIDIPVISQIDDVLDLDAALTKLATVDDRAAQVIKLCIFGGLTLSQAADSLELSPHQAKRSWTYARAWLRRELKTGP